MKALAERYAAALVDVALANHQADQVKQELAQFAGMMRESPDLHAFLSNPSIARAAKHSAVEAAGCAHGRQPHAAQLSVCDRGPAARRDAGRNRAGLQPSAGCAAGHHAGHGYLRLGIDRPRNSAELDAALAKLTGQRVQAQYTTDPALIGGAVVRIGSTIYDGSVRTQLERLRARMIIGIGVRNGFD